MNISPGTAREYCNNLALACGLDPAGHAGSFSDALVLETPLPWKRDIYQVAGALPQQVIDLLALWLQRYEAGQPYDHSILMAAPDPEYSRKGCRRVIYYTRPPGQFAHFARMEYLAPEEEVGALVWALYETPSQLPSFARYQIPAAVLGGRLVRDILVCTHGTVDVACARFGYPLYRQLRDTYSNEELRIWRVSHFGGHVFAPTLLDMPTGQYWAYIGDTQARQIIERTGDVAALRPHMRGWAGLDRSFDQVADCAIWQREGWSWLDAARHGELLAQDVAGDDPQWAKVRVAYTWPEGRMGAYTALVSVTHKVETRSSTGDSQGYAYPQYAVTELQAEEPCSELAGALAGEHPQPVEAMHG